MQDRDGTLGEDAADDYGLPKRAGPRFTQRDEDPCGGRRVGHHWSSSQQAELCGVRLSLCSLLAKHFSPPALLKFGVKTITDEISRSLGFEHCSVSSVLLPTKNPPWERGGSCGNRCSSLLPGVPCATQGLISPNAPQKPWFSLLFLPGRFCCVFSCTSSPH